MRQLKALLAIAIVVGGFYLAWVLIPPYYNNYSFQDELENQARTAVYSPQTTDQDVKNSLAKTAKDLDIPLTADDIHVEKTNGNISIWTEYTITVQTPVKAIDLKFAPSTKDKRI
jgi:predicted membrane protein